MQTNIQDFCVKRYAILTDKCEKKLENFADLAEDKAESTAYKVIDNLADKVIGRVETLMTQHTTQQTATMLEITQGKHALQVEKLRE